MSDSPEVAKQPEISPIEAAWNAIEDISMDDSGELVARTSTADGSTQDTVSETSSSEAQNTGVSTAPPASTEQPPTEDESKSVPIERFKGLEKEVTRKANEVNELKKQLELQSAQFNQILARLPNFQPNQPNGEQPQGLDAQEIFTDMPKAVNFTAAMYNEMKKRDPEWAAVRETLARHDASVELWNMTLEAQKMMNDPQYPNFKESIPEMKELVEEHPEKNFTMKEAYQIVRKKRGDVAGIQEGAATNKNGTATATASKASLTPAEVQARVAKTSVARGVAAPTETPRRQINTPRDAMLTAFDMVGQD